MISKMFFITWDNPTLAIGWVPLALIIFLAVTYAVWTFNHD